MKANYDTSVALDGIVEEIMVPLSRSVCWWPNFGHFLQLYWCGIISGTAEATSQIFICGEDKQRTPSQGGGS